MEEAQNILDPRTPESLQLEGNVIRLETPNGLPCTVIPFSDAQKIGKGDAKVSSALLVTAPNELVPEVLCGAATRELKEMREADRRSLVGRLAVATGLAAAAIAGCSCGGYNPNSSDSDSYSTLKTALTSVDLDNLAPQLEACFTQPDDIRPNIGTFNGETVVTFIRDDHCYYVKAADIMSALTSECEAQLIDLPGVLEPEASPIPTCAVHDNKIYYKRGWEPLIKADLVDDTGVLGAQNPQWVENNINTGSISIVVEDGVPFLLHTSGGGHIVQQNLVDNTVTNTVVDDACEVPHMDPDTGVWVGSHFENYGGGVQCRLIQAPTLAELQSSLQFIPGIMVEGEPPTLEGESKNPRIVGEVMIFEGHEKDPDNPGTLLPGKIYYALVTEYCGDGECNGDETSDDCLEDCPLEPVCGDGSCNGDETLADCPEDCAVCGDGTCTNPPETNANCATDCPPEPFCGDDICNGTETTATCPEDCPTPDPCDAFIDDGRITFVEGQELCEMIDCIDDDPFGESFTIQGNCSFEIDFGNPNPVEFSIYGANDSPDGAVHIDFLENAAHELLRGGADVNDNGNHHGSVYRRNGHMVELGAEGTGYIEKEAIMPGTGNPAYYAKCTEGRTSLYKNGEFVAELTAGGTKLIDMGENIDPDGGVDGGDGNGDNPPGCGSCNTGNGKIPAGELAFIGMMLLALTRRMRSVRRESLIAKSKRMPGSLLLSHVRSRVTNGVRRFFDKF